MSWAPGRTKTNKYTLEGKYKGRNQVDEYKDLGVSRRNRWRRGEVGFRRSTRILRIICKKRFLYLLVTREIEVEV